MKFPTKTPTKRWFDTANDGHIFGTSSYYTTEKYNQPAKDAYDYDDNGNNISDWFETNKLVFTVVKTNSDGTKTEDTYYLDYLISFKDKISGNKGTISLMPTNGEGEPEAASARLTRLLKEYIKDKIASGYNKEGIKSTLPGYLIKNHPTLTIKETDMKGMAFDFDGTDFKNLMQDSIKEKTTAYGEKLLSNQGATGTVKVTVTVK